MTKKILNLDYEWSARAENSSEKGKAWALNLWNPGIPRTPKVGRDGQAEEIRELCRALWAVKEIYGICGCSNQAWVS